ncbi:MAG: glycosyltransferase, partial [Patescibacteria group bacterium]|nr:glycosyltransferase [Patescibacteria group bacterium]
FEKLTHRPKFSIITPTFNTDNAILDKTIKSVEEQYYPNWELCICDDGSSNKETKELLKDRSFRNPKLKVVFSETNEGISTASNKALDLASGEYVILLDHDDMLTKNALMEIAIILNKNTDIDFIYSDEDKIDEKDNHMEPFFKPDWSPDLLFSYNYPIHVSVFRKSILQKIGGFRKQFDGSQDYDVILRFIEITNKIVHIPKVLYSWRKISGSTALSMGEKNYAYDSGKDALSDAIRRRKIDAIVENGIDSGRYRIKYAIREKPLVSVIIPTRNMVNLKTCLTSIFDRSYYNNLEIIVLDNSTTHEIKNFCNGFRQVKRLDISGWKFNFSRFNNYGVTKSNG